jgi:hypothetical protein
MRLAAAAFLSSVAAALLVVSPGTAQDRPPAAPDPRVGLQAGFRDAGIGAAHLELVATVPRPEGFFDPRNPAGLPTPPESSPAEERPDEGGAADVLSQLEANAAEFDSRGTAVNAIDRSRLRALAETVGGISAARRAAR